MATYASSRPKNAPLSRLMKPGVVFARQLALGCVLCVLGCRTPAEHGQEVPSRQAPSLLNISTRSISVGEDLSFVCAGCAGRTEGHVELELSGTFVADTGGSESVSLRVARRTDQDNNVIWRNFGRYRVPFGECAAGGRCSTGSFSGTICATNRYNDGETFSASGAQCLNASLEVKPSFVVREFFAFDDQAGWRANCREPATTALGGLSYQFEVEAVGFSPRAIEYTVSEGFEADSIVSVTPVALRREVAPLEDGTTRHALLIRPTNVLANSMGYQMSIGVRGTGDPQLNQDVELDFSFVVRNPISAFLRPRGWQVPVEVYPVQEIEGCNSGHTTNNNNVYSNTVSRESVSTTSRTLSSSWNRTRAQQHEEALGRSESESATTSTGVSAVDGRKLQAGYKVGVDSSASVARSFSRAEGVSEATNTYGINNMTDIRQTNEKIYGTRENPFQKVIQNGNETELFGGVGYSGPFNRIGEAMGAAVNAAGSTVRVGLSVQYAEKRRNIEALTTGVITNQVRGLVTTGQGGTVRNTGTTETVTEGQTTNAVEGASVGSAWGETSSLENANSERLSEMVGVDRSYRESVTNLISFANNEERALEEVFSTKVVESETAQVKQPVWAGLDSMLYEQRIKFVTLFDVVAFDLCGNGTVVGESVITSWQVSRELALDDRCAPRHCLNFAECRAPEYCDGEYPGFDEQENAMNPVCMAERKRGIYTYD